jgi:hypothetical protein
MKLKNNGGRINLVFRASSYQPFDRLMALSGADGLKRSGDDNPGANQSDILPKFIRPTFS